jgi:hypothetical protein
MWRGYAPSFPKVSGRDACPALHGYESGNVFQLQKSRRILFGPCGFELFDDVDVSLPLGHAQRRASRRCRCNIRALFVRGAAGLKRLCLSRQ